MSNVALNTLCLIFGILVVTLFVLANKYATESTTQHAVKPKVCLGGVSYYEYSELYKGYLAPVFNKDTKQVELCNE